MKIDFNKALGLLDVLPGQKRTVISLFMVGMAICQSLATYAGPQWGHVFSATEWGAAVSMFAVAYQLKLVREEKEKSDETK